MQTLHQEIDPSPQGLTTNDHPVLQGLVADSEESYADEVRLLRERVVALEAALAAAKAARANGATAVREAPPLTSIDFAPPCPTTQPAEPDTPSEFTRPVTPAVVSIAAPAPAEPEAAPISPGGAHFAEAWDEGEGTTFEERVAEKAFFEASSIDQQSRNWLLDTP